MIAAAAASLAEPHAFITKTYLDLPILLVRGADGQARAFVNVCRHRGARVEAAEAGCKRVFTCPYHGWSWSSDGTLRHVPHAAQGFPDLDLDSLGLAALPCVERHGFVWIIADPAVADAPDLDAWLGPLNADLTWLGLADHVSAASDTIEVAANWKLLMEGGLEAYHFRVAHKETIGAYFPDNLSTYAAVGPHLRSVLPRATISDMRAMPERDWRSRIT
jgi:phenylpropionate dioxygenase-like ring-hydroxylating dioxygenase large terminal subunit